MNIIVTGAAGFIGSNFADYIAREHPEYGIIAVDALTYAGNFRNLEALARRPNFRFVRIDVCDPNIREVVETADAVVHLAAETHVDRSLEDPGVFMRTNVEGTRNLLEACVGSNVKRFVLVSTDEVYGSIASGSATEESPLNPTSPYAKSKAMADQIALEFAGRDRLPVSITRCTNNYGPRQFPEKFIPLMIAQALMRKPLPVYGDGQNVRDWIYVEDHCRALDLVLARGQAGEAYNIATGSELRNLEVVSQILERLRLPADLIQFVADRPGHDRRYALDASKIRRTLGWRPQVDFAAGLDRTIRWYQENGDWLKEVSSGSYREYFQRHYGEREALLARLRES